MNVASDQGETRFPDSTAFLLDGAGGARRAEPADLSSPPEGAAFGWLHLRRDADGTGALLHAAGLDAFVAAALCADETRPRCTYHGDGAILILRGVNLNPGAEPEDMVSVRLWVEEHRIVSVGIRPLAAVTDLFAALDRGQAPATPGALVARLAIRLADFAEPVVAGLNERVDTLEEQIMERARPEMRADLADLRRVAIQLRRFMLPQRDALTTFDAEDLPWLGREDQSRIREAAERVTRLGEELDAIRDRAQIVYDQITDARAEDMNRQMLILSIVAAIFLPLGLITGLLGVNVAGIPGADYPYAFWLLCAVLVAICAVQIWLFRKIGLMGRRH